MGPDESCGKSQKLRPGSIEWLETLAEPVGIIQDMES